MMPVPPSIPAVTHDADYHTCPHIRKLKEENDLAPFREAVRHLHYLQRPRRHSAVVCEVGMAFIMARSQGFSPRLELLLFFGPLCSASGKARSKPLRERNAIDLRSLRTRHASLWIVVRMCVVCTVCGCAMLLAGPRSPSHGWEWLTQQLNFFPYQSGNSSRIALI